jgi:hypothetical protein
MKPRAIKVSYDSAIAQLAGRHLPDAWPGKSDDNLKKSTLI